MDKFESLFIPYIKKPQNESVDLKIRAKIIKVLEDNVGVNFVILD